MLFRRKIGAKWRSRHTQDTPSALTTAVLHPGKCANLTSKRRTASTLSFKGRLPSADIPKVGFAFQYVRRGMGRVGTNVRRPSRRQAVEFCEKQFDAPVAL
eukprot:1856439-Pyramimonas_sp.AAC.1